MREKQQLIDVLKQYHDNRFTPQVYEHSIFGKAALPLERSEEVVRCKDCKHRRDDEDYVSGHYCVKRPSNGGRFCEDNDFCSYGERRTDA